MTKKLSRSTKAGRNLLPLTKRTLHDGDVVKEVGQNALKVSVSETYFLVEVEPPSYAGGIVGALLV